MRPASPQGPASPAGPDGAKPRSAALSMYRDQSSPQPAQQTGRSAADSGCHPHGRRPGKPTSRIRAGHSALPTAPHLPPVCLTTSLSRPILPIPPSPCRSGPCRSPPVPTLPGRTHTSLPPGSSCPSCLLSHSRSSRHAPAASTHPRDPRPLQLIPRTLSDLPPPSHPSRLQPPPLLSGPVASTGPVGAIGPIGPVRPDAWRPRIAWFRRPAAPARHSPPTTSGITTNQGVSQASPASPRYATPAAVRKRPAMSFPGRNS